jgi:hypothetical protein
MSSERPKRIPFVDLMETARSFPQEVRADPNRQTFTLAVSIIRHFLGQQWCEGGHGMLAMHTCGGKSCR